MKYVLALFTMAGGMTGLVLVALYAEQVWPLSVEPVTAFPAAFGGIVVGGFLGLIVALGLVELPRVITGGWRRESLLMPEPIARVMLIVGAVVLAVGGAAVAAIMLVWLVSLIGQEELTNVAAVVFTIGSLFAAGLAGRAVNRAFTGGSES